MHCVAILELEVSSLCKANEALSKRWRAKRTRIQLKGSLAIQDAKELVGQEAAVREVAQEKEQDSSAVGGGRTKVRCCSVYGKPGHNARTCQEAVEASDLAVSNVIIVGSQCCCVAIEDSGCRVVESVSLAYMFHSLINYVTYVTVQY